MPAGSGSTNSTVPPSSRSRPAISSLILSKPSRSPLPDSIETRSLSVSRTGAFSFAASDITGSSGAAHTSAGAAAINKQIAPRMLLVALADFIRFPRFVTHQGYLQIARYRTPYNSFLCSYHATGKQHAHESLV